MSGGKDSSTTAALLVEFLRSRSEMELIGITIDEGIASYRPAGIDFAKRLCARLGIEHRVLAYQETSGHTMDEVVARDPESIPCSYCGPFRRQALNRAAVEVGADYVATGLNACARGGEPTVSTVCKACELRERIEKIGAPDVTEPLV